VAEERKKERKEGRKKEARMLALGVMIVVHTIPYV